MWQIIIPRDSGDVKLINVRITLWGQTFILRYCSCLANHFSLIDSNEPGWAKEPSGSGLAITHFRFASSVRLSCRLTVA
jgi:hypothetical protein